MSSCMQGQGSGGIARALGPPKKTAEQEDRGWATHPASQRQWAAGAQHRGGVR
jgi:hypothetical protein